jgi:hypothetical protein
VLPLDEAAASLELSALTLNRNHENKI